MSGPDDAVGRFAREGALVIGGARAILLQLADPVVGEAVAEHSAFARDPMGRLRNTLTFAYAVVIGTPAQADAVVRLVDRLHGAVPGATDPDRQLWVAATLYDTAMRMHLALVGAVDAPTADAVYREYGRLGTALQVPDGAWPPDRAAFAAYWRRTSGSLAVTDAARRVAHDLLHARALPWWGRAALPLVRVVTAGALPARMREAYGLEHRPVVFLVTMGLLRSVIALLPRSVREAPARHCLAVLDRRLGGSGGQSARMR